MLVLAPSVRLFLKRLPVSGHHSQTRPRLRRRCFHSPRSSTKALISAETKAIPSALALYFQSSASSAAAKSSVLSPHSSPTLSSSSSSLSSSSYSYIQPLLRRRPNIQKRQQQQVTITTPKSMTEPTPTPAPPTYAQVMPAPVVTKSPPKPQPSFYRRVLPSECIGFSSPEGRKIFAQALTSEPNYMQIYFPLAEQFTTQAEPAYCGLATLAMCLNALQIDPNRPWKGVWRWFSEELFECCTSLSVAKEKGISYTEFICLAKCNGVQTESIRANGSLSLNEFRDLVKRCCSTSEEILVLNYSRQALNQTGDGHFSPIGGYHEEKDMVLLLDVARFKYPPHWVKLSVAFEAMHRIDASSGLPRGLIVLKQNASLNRPCQSSTVTSVDISTSVGINHYHHQAQTVSVSMSSSSSTSDNSSILTSSSTATTISTAAVSRWPRQFPW